MADEYNLPPPSDDKPATMGQVRAIIRRRIRKHEAHEELGLNIYPMMDMMTILLVFLVAQFAAAQADVMQTTDLVLPYSSSKVEPQSVVSVQLSRTSILVDGDLVIPLRDGVVDPSQKRGGGNGFLINQLLTRMEEKRDFLRALAQRYQNHPFTGEVRIIGDRRTPFRTLSEVIYTLGQAGFNNLRFVTLQNPAANTQ